MPKNKQKPIGIELYVGAGGLSLGCEQAGFDVIYAVENDRYAAETYMKNRQDKSVYVDTRDIRKISPLEILKKLGLKKGELGFVIGGPPCQGFSISNMRTRNMNNPQNCLVFKFVEFLEKLKPKWFLMENVGGLDNFENGKLKERLINRFRKIGYTTECAILNAANFGVPQNRNRIFFVGNRVGQSMKFIETIKSKKKKKIVTVHEAISDLPHLENGHNISQMHYNGGGKPHNRYQAMLRKKTNGKVLNNIVSHNSDLVLERYKYISQGKNILALKEKAPHLITNYKNVDNCHHWIYLRLPPHKPSVTINNYRKNMLIHPEQNRGLSVREAARLQSFPDDYVFYGSIGFQQQQVANAVPPLMAKAVFKAIGAHLQ